MYNNADNSIACNSKILKKSIIPKENITTEQHGIG